MPTIITQSRILIEEEVVVSLVLVQIGSERLRRVVKNE